jgi:hypothetical protein
MTIAICTDSPESHYLELSNPQQQLELLNKEIQPPRNKQKRKYVTELLYLDIIRDWEKRELKENFKRGKFMASLRELEEVYVMEYMGETDIEIERKDSAIQNHLR